MDVVLRAQGSFLSLLFLLHKFSNSIVHQTVVWAVVCMCKPVCVSVSVCMYIQRATGCLCICRELIYRFWQQKTADGHAVLIFPSVAYRVKSGYFCMHTEYRAQEEIGNCGSAGGPTPGFVLFYKSCLFILQLSGNGTVGSLTHMQINIICSL